MAYIPPHKRHSKDSESSSPTPESLIPQFKRNLNPRSFNVEKRKNKYSFQGGKIIYGNDAIDRWFTVGLADEIEFSSVTCLKPVSLESIQRKQGEKPLALVLNDRVKEENKEVTEIFLNSPWNFVAENVKQDLLSAFENVKNEIESQEVEEVKPTLVARFGKILFHGSRSVNLESVRSSSVAEYTLRQLKRSFYTNVSSSFVNHIINNAVPMAGLELEKVKKIYHVKIFDKMRPDSTISCKCFVKQDFEKLELYKIGLKQVRYLVADMSCLGKNMDLRLMLCTKRTITSLTDDEMHSIRSIISSAILDPEVKGGLRWPLGKESFGERYAVVGVWYTDAKAFTSSSVRLNIRHADRFDFRSSVGEATEEVSLKLKGIPAKLQFLAGDDLRASHLLQEKSVDIDLVSEMLKDNLKLIWESFLCYGEQVE
ncbi:hypothetical protein RJ639_012184 [Escallonia herrerae]|uniref:DUF7903 domain-containing protein n=1 Tax=Escallonia herrerae TaxID=1293975 RepID=A0AA88VLZ8_9ASTE|nr:hypothetical protein RJ639_012184 [Escallonia herrerae]